MKETDMLKELKKLLMTFHIQEIESVTGLGIPDVNYGHARICGWMELKELDRASKYATDFKIPWRPGQFGWFRRYQAKCNAPYILCLTIKDRWFFFSCYEAPYIKEEYTLEELMQAYIGTTKELINHRSRIIDILLGRAT